MGNLMTLTDKHINYETNCRQMFVGQIIRGVIYGEVKYFFDENGNNVNPEPCYKTKYPDIDTLDHSIYFTTDEKTIHVFWDNTFISYGLLSAQIDPDGTTNANEQQWNVTSDPKWADCIGSKIVGFKILWAETCTSELDGSNKVYTTYPQSFEIKTDRNKTIILSAAEFQRPEEIEIFSLMDNLLVTTNVDLARQLKLIE
jgi:hypothetical protein